MPTGFGCFYRQPAYRPCGDASCGATSDSRHSGTGWQGCDDSFDDADLTRACDAALYGAFSNSGQACVSVERLFVQRGCHDALFATWWKAWTLHLGYGEKGDLGVMTSIRQMANVQRQYDDAIAKGAKVSGLLQVKGNFLNPVVCWEMKPDMLLMREETFGPLLPVISFDTAEEAIRLANDSKFGLNASVWSRNIAKAEQVAAKLEVGNWAVNDVLKTSDTRLAVWRC